MNEKKQIYIPEGIYNAEEKAAMLAEIAEQKAALQGCNTDELASQLADATVRLKHLENTFAAFLGAIGYRTELQDEINEAI